MRRDAEGRAALMLVLNDDPRFVYAEAGAESGEFLLHESGEGGGRLVMAVLEYQFHDAAGIGPEIAFEKYYVWNREFQNMKSATPAPQWLNFHHLRYFHAVAAEGSIRAAAEKLRLSQPSMCTQIKQLETSFGERLFRRSGRTLVLTEFGRIVHTYATDIFALGQELLTAARSGPSARTMRLQAGIVDSFPKLLSLDILRPVFSHTPRVLLSCHEGKLEDLLGQLAAHRLDVVLSDEPAPAHGTARTFTHALGSTGTTFCAAPSLARTLKGRFPANLRGAPALLPTPNTPQRRELETWFRQAKVEPRVVAEFADAALSKIVATEGLGFTAVPTIVASDAVERYGYEILGRTEDCRTHLYLLTAERRLEHPAVATLAMLATESLARRGHTRKKVRQPNRTEH
jgi:LysR family transcriptional regulator, transcriptional activator of nhaA